MVAGQRGTGEGQSSTSSDALVTAERSQRNIYAIIHLCKDRNGWPTSCGAPLEPRPKNVESPVELPSGCVSSRRKRTSRLPRMETVMTTLALSPRPARHPLPLGALALGVAGRILGSPPRGSGRERLMPEEPEPKRLFALMLYCAARFAARRDANGRLVPLDPPARGRGAADRCGAGRTFRALSERGGHPVGPHPAPGHGAAESGRPSHAQRPARLPQRRHRRPDRAGRRDRRGGRGGETRQPPRCGKRSP
jgi:hypothetical protein